METDRDLAVHSHDIVNLPGGEHLLRATQILALGYHDGPTSGFVHCECGAVLRFEAQETDYDRDLTVFAFGETPVEEFEGLWRDLAAELPPPKTAVWVPRWEFRRRRPSA